MIDKKPKSTKLDSDITPEEREAETVRRYKEAIEAAIKKKTPKPDPEVKPDLDETIPGR